MKFGVFWRPFYSRLIHQNLMNPRMDTVIVKISKVRYTASYCKIAMKPSSPEMWTCLDYGLKQVIFTCSSKQVGEEKEKKKKKSETFVPYRVVKILQEADLGHHNLKWLNFICIASMLLTKKGHILVFLSLTMTASKKYLLPLPLQASDFWVSPNLLPLHKTPTRSYPVCQQALRDLNLS